MKETNRPKYNMWQNTWFMVKRANSTAKVVLILAALQVIIGVLMNLMELFVTPVLLWTVGSAKTVKDLIMVILFFAVGFLLLDAANGYVECNAVYGRVHVRVGLVTECVGKMCRTSYPNIENPAFLERRDKASNAMTSNAEATEAVWGTLTALLKNGICFLIWLCLLASLNPFLIAVTLAAACADYLVTSHLYGWSYRHREEEDKYRHEMGYVTERCRDHKLAKDLRIFGMGKWLEDIWENTLRMYQHFRSREERVYLRADICSILFTLLRNGLAYAYLIMRILQGSMDAAAFVLYFSALGGFSAQIAGILTDLTTLHRQSLDISRVREFTEEEELFLFEEGKAIEPEKKKPYCIELDHVSFRYPGAKKDTIKDISLTIKPGEKLAVVGLNGAGKTTLIKLICGLYDPTSGSVRLNGEDIRVYNRRDYYRHFSAVFQKYSVLAGTVAENVSQTDEETDMEKVKSCIARAGIKNKIEALPHGYETKLVKEVFEDATELSGGEMQRLLMARALYKNAPIMVLDEPTAALDPIAESDIYQKYNDLTKDCTSVFISHRLASTRFCDRIILLEDGLIAEEGTHEQLMEKNGKYAGLFEVQSRYYKEGKADGNL